MDPEKIRQPNPDWPWMMEVGGKPPEDVARHVKLALEWLSPDGKSFVSLRQEAPNDPEQYWFIQCLISICGPGEGQYVVQCGYSGNGGPVLLERYCPDLEDVFALFRPALEYESVDFSSFTQFLRQPDGSWQAVQQV